ncbi:MAG TPA: glycosyl hydrolase family 28-related protein [Pyrinomonadaceae bacterium]|nr:glycosyl hydrolase family 28-related protein [Pyrinomonadaceae bacterium]
MKKMISVCAVALALCVSAFAQNRLEGYNIIVDAPTNHRQATCAVRYVPPSTVITVTDLNPSTPLKLTACDGSDSRLTMNAAAGTASLLASPTNYKWCFRGEDEHYRLTFQMPGIGPVTYDWFASKDAATRGFYNIRDFGAVGDGKTDDTRAFKSAMAVIASNNGGMLTIPDGDYVVSETVTLPSAITIRGTNGLQSMAPTGDVPRKNPARITLSGSKKPLFRIGECTEMITLSDVELYAQSNDGTTGIEAVGAYRTSQGFNIDRVIFHNFNRGISAYGLPQTDLNWQFDYIHINACRFVFSREAGIYTNIRNTDWRIQNSFFVNPRRTATAKADSMFFERAAGILIDNTVGGGDPGTIGGTFLNILDSANVLVSHSSTESMTNSFIYNEAMNPLAGDYASPVVFLNNAFGNPIIFNARRTFVSTGNIYSGNVFKAGELVRVYSTGDRFCYDGHISGCRGVEKKNFDKATVVFMTGQPSEGQVKGHPTFFGTDVEFGSPVQMPTFQVNSLPQGKANGSMVYCANCRRSSTPCQGGGSGAPAMVVGNQWSCL